mgnify:CR=1 FL=1
MVNNMKIEDIEKIIHMFEKAKISTLELEVDDVKIKLDKKEAIIQPVAINNTQTIENAEPEVNDGEAVTSPIVGTFHTRPFPDSEPFVNLGDRVKKGDKLCIIEAMKVMNEIISPYDGVVKKILVTNGKMVEYGQELFIIGE